MKRLGGLAIVVIAAIVLLAKKVAAKEDFVSVNPDGTCRAGYRLFVSSINNWQPVCASDKWIQEHPEYFV